MFRVEPQPGEICIILDSYMFDLKLRDQIQQRKLCNPLLTKRSKAVFYFKITLRNEHFYRRLKTLKKVNKT